MSSGRPASQPAAEIGSRLRSRAIVGLLLRSSRTLHGQGSCVDVGCRLSALTSAPEGSRRLTQPSSGILTYPSVLQVAMIRFSRRSSRKLIRSSVGPRQTMMMRVDAAGNRVLGSFPMIHTPYGGASAVDEESEEKGRVRHSAVVRLAWRHRNQRRQLNCEIAPRSTSRAAPWIPRASSSTASARAETSRTKSAATRAI